MEFNGAGLERKRNRIIGFFSYEKELNPVVTNRRILSMGLFEKMEAALQAGDVETVASFYHVDFEMKMHSNGSVMTKEQWKAGAASIFSNSNFKREAARCIYENDDILVSHAIMTFPNGSKDAVIWVGTKKDGLIHRVETGSTPLSV